MLLKHRYKTSSCFRFKLNFWHNNQTLCERDRSDGEWPTHHPEYQGT